MMGSSLIGSLRVALGMDTAQFEAGSKRAKAEAASLSGTISKHADTANKALGLIGIGISLGAVVEAGKRALEYASSLGEVSQQLGVTSKDLQVYRFAATQVGISQEEMDKGLAKLSVTIGQASQGQKKQVTTFRELGVSVQDASGHVKTAGEIIPALAEALSKITDPATRARIEVELFGKTGQKLDTLLAGGRKGVSELSDAAERLGIVLSDKQIQTADATADKLAAVKQVLEAKLAGVVADNAGSIITFANALGYVADKAGEAIKGLRVFFAQAKLNRANERVNELELQGGDTKSLRFAYANVVSAGSELHGALGGFAPSAQKSAAAPRPSLSSGPLPTVRPSGGRRTGKTDAQKQAEKDAASYKELLASLLPLTAEYADFDKKQAALQSKLASGVLSADDFSVAMQNLTAKHRDIVGALLPANEALSIEADKLLDLDKVSDGVIDGFHRAAEASEAAREKLNAPFVDLADGINNSLSQLDLLEGGFKSLENVALDVLDQIGKALIAALSPAGADGGIGGLIAGGVKNLLGLGASSGVASLRVTNAELGSVAPIGLHWAKGGSALIGGYGGVDSNVLSINGSPIAAVSRGERVSVTPHNDNGRGVTVIQNFSPNYAGNAASKEDLVHFAGVVKADTIRTFRDMRSRGQM